MEVTLPPSALGGMQEKLLLSSIQTPSKHKHLAALDGLRGLAALAVLVVHVIGEMHLRTSSNSAPLDSIIPHVHLAVDFFFMLSGFVIAKAYETKLVTIMSFPDFMTVRFIRLYPLIFAGVCLGTLSIAIRVAFTHTPSVRNLLAAALSAFAILPTTALLSVFKGELFPIDFPEWSLLFELVINVVYGATVRWLSTSKLIAVCAVSLIPLCIVAASSDSLLDIGMGLHRVGIIPADIWCGFIRVTFSFFLGVLLFRRRLSWVTRGATSIILSVVFLTVLFLPAFPHSWRYEVFAVVVIFPIILSLSATCRTGPILNACFLFLGELSYPLYITHNPVTKLLINAFKLLHIRLPDGAALAIYCLVAIAVAILLLHIWDQPIRRWLSDRVRRKSLSIKAISLASMS